MHFDTAARARAVDGARRAARAEIFETEAPGRVNAPGLGIVGLVFVGIGAFAPTSVHLF